MALVNQPPILASSFAVNGDKNTIPTTNSGTEGLASLSLGFPPITQQPVSQGGIPPQRADFNGIFNLITNFLMFIQNGSIFAYSSSLDYQPPAIVYGNNALYRCIATNGANTSAGVQSLSNTSYWQPLIPVGGITVSGNTITVTNETGTQIQYTIDTITNPPSQSDSSNKIVTSAWVKAYAPSKTGTGASGTWNITANKAIADKNGLQIDTGYLKLSGGKLTGVLSFGPTEATKLINLEYSTSNNVFRIVSQGIGYYLNFLNANTATSQNDLICNFPTSPTAPTPSTSDNSTKVATTAFVKSLFTASKTTNGWWKDGNTGMIWQWGRNSGGSGISAYYVSFPITFPNAVVMAGGFTLSTSTGNEHNSGSCGNVTTSGMNVVFENSGGYWLAIGY